MEGRSAVWLLAALLLVEVLISAEAQNSPEYFEVGGELVLKPEPFSDPIRSITWKSKGNIVGVLDEGQSLSYNPVFKDRARVDTTTGVLEISNMMKTDDGLYTVTINNKIQSLGYNVRVIAQVPKSVVTISPDTCSKELKSCSLSCGGDITEAEPVTFYFKKGDGGWEEGEQSMTIMNDATTQAVKTFSCRMKNPLGQKDSDPVDNPFYVEPKPVPIVGIVFGVLISVVCAVVGGVVCLKKQKCGTITGATTAPSTKENGDQGAPLNDVSPERGPNPKEDV